MKTETETPVKKKRVAKPKAGPAIYKRNDFGLLAQVNYEFNEDGSVDWRKMIKDEHLYPNKDWFESRNKEIPTSIEGLDDCQLLIKLSGIKELAKMRGFSRVEQEILESSPERVVCKCSITWFPNYECDDKEVTYTDTANATLDNTSSFATKFLETIAANRAFVRAVRNFLNIHIVGDDEIDKSDHQKPSSSKGFTPQSVLASNFGSFDDFKEKLRDLYRSEKYRNDEVKNWGSFEDIPPKEARTLLGLVKS
jgi:hypothetical protein